MKDIGLLFLAISLLGHGVFGLYSTYSALVDENRNLQNIVDSSREAMGRVMAHRHVEVIDGSVAQLREAVANARPDGCILIPEAVFIHSGEMHKGETIAIDQLIVVWKPGDAGWSTIQGLTMTAAE